MKKTRIGILGIGGIGGYYGGLLAKHYHSSSNYEVVFIARGKQKEVLRKNGLHLKTSQKDFVIQPNLVSDNPKEIGPLDILIMCTKAFQIENSISQYKDCISAETIIISLMNGVENAEKLQELLPGHQNILNGCVYIASNLESAGVVWQKGGKCNLIFGKEKGDNLSYVFVEKILRQAGIDATLSDNIRKVVWEKYLFVSPVANITSYKEITFGEILESPENMDILKKLIEEVFAVAQGKGVKLANNSLLKPFEVLKNFTYGAKSSLQIDFEKKKDTEIATFTHYIINEAHRLNIEVPTYQMISTDLDKRL